MNYIVYAALGYFIGAIPFSYIFPKLKGVDVRKVGSGNVGGTNALRAVGPLLGGLSMLFDILKAFIPVLVVYKITGDPKMASATALGCVFGHDFPIYLKFKGGKGVATTLGTMLALCWQCSVVFLAIWFFIVTLTKYVSLASIVSLYIASAFALVFHGETIGIPLIIMATLSLLRHTSNIQRLMKGQERKTDIWGYLKR